MANQKNWQAELEVLQSIIQKTELIKTIKWGAEVYTHNGKNVISYTGFKNHFAIWFFNGAFLKDEQGVLFNAQDGKTKALRQWRFTSIDEINENLILEYIRESIQNVEEGKVWKPEKSGSVKIPDLLLNAFDEDKKLKTAFDNITPYKQREFIEYIDSAKREATRKSRLQKIIPMIIQGIGLNDKYRSS